MPGSTTNGNGANSLRQFYKRIAADQDFRALTASEAIARQKYSDDRWNLPCVLD